MKHIKNFLSLQLVSFFACPLVGGLLSVVGLVFCDLLYNFYINFLILGTEQIRIATDENLLLCWRITSCVLFIIIDVLCLFHILTPKQKTI